MLLLLSSVTSILRIVDNEIYRTFALESIYITDKVVNVLIVSAVRVLSDNAYFRQVSAVLEYLPPSVDLSELFLGHLLEEFFVLEVGEVVEESGEVA